MSRNSVSQKNDSPPDIPSSVSAGIGRDLALWYAGHRRDLPWRRTSDPYRIWISEVMLQQTQVKTALPYYRRFMDRFPDVFRLAGADLQEVLKLWEGLGYYSRARNMHKAANAIADGGGRFPSSWETVMQLPGVGDYIGSAVLSIAFDQPFAVVDGNVKRVLARLFLLPWPVNQSPSHGLFKAVADQLLDRRHPGDHNQAMMELGALVCTPRRPLCGSCPVSKHCRAFGSDAVGQYPRRIKRAAVPRRHSAVGMVEKNGLILCVQRPGNGLLGGLWEFPGGGVDADEDSAQMCKRHIKMSVNLDVSVGALLTTVQHTYTHFKLHMDVYACRWTSGRVYLRGSDGFKWIKPSQISDLPLHGAMHKALKIIL